MNAGCGVEERAAAAYEWAAGLVGLARRLIADGTDVDLTPIRPAIQELCGALRQLPAVQAREWVNHLLELQRELAALGHDLAVRRQDAPESDGASDGASDRASDRASVTGVDRLDVTQPSTQGEGPTCR